MQVTAGIFAGNVMTLIQIISHKVLAMLWTKLTAAYLTDTGIDIIKTINICLNYYLVLRDIYFFYLTQ